MPTASRTIRNWANLAFSVSALLLLTACGEQAAVGPTSQPEALDDAGAQALAVTVLNASDARLPFLPALLRASHEAINSQDDNAEAVTAFRKARRARAAAQQAREAGEADRAERLHRMSYRFTLTGVVAALGPEVAHEAIAGVDAAIARWEERLAGRDAPARFARALATARELAEAARSQDSAAAALGRALRAAEVIRSVSPAHVARRAVTHARNSFQTARRAVGDSATDEENGSLRRAHALLARANEFLESKEWRTAIRAARASTEISQRVIDGRGD
jgi:hypothetical protein